MAQITSSVGLISGINTGSIINQLIAIDAQPITLLQAQSDSANAQAQAFQGLAATLADMQSIGNSLALPQTFQNTTASSSDSSVLTATSGIGAAVGSYQFQVSRLVSTQQSISSGFANASTALVGAGTITLDLGGGQASSQTPLADLNGGTGIQRGQFRITDGSGNSAVIDTSNDVTLDDVVQQINSALNISVKATVTNGGLVITDNSGLNTTPLTIRDLGGGSSAASLGIVGQSNSGSITGTAINYISTSTALNQLNDGRGINTTSAAQTDFIVGLSDGTQVNVSLNGSSTLGDVINAINTAGGGKLTASINSAKNGVQLTDSSGGGGTMTITAQNGSSAASDLGLTAPATGNSIAGSPLIAGLDSVLLSSLNGGQGIPMGTISITDRGGQGGNINLSGATSLSDVINDINNNSVGARVTASLNSAGTGIQITDNSGASGNLVIADVNSTTAAGLGLAGTYNTTQSADGGSLHMQYVSENTLLSDYDGGQGVSNGQFLITNSNGVSAAVDLSQGTFTTIGDVINAINAKNIGVTASINSTGNGIQLTDSAGGANAMSVTDLGGTTAASLNIAGAATGNVIDGAEEKTISVTSTDTLTTLAAKINQLGWGVSANVINDGSTSNGYRLSITARNSGANGAVTIDDGNTNLNTRTLVQGQNAAVFLGGGNGSATQPLLVTSSTNTLTNIIQGVTINLVGASSSPVTLSVSNSPDDVEQSLQKFVTDFNTLVTTIGTDTQFNTTTNQGGILLGVDTTNQIQSTLYDIVNSIVHGAGPYKMLADVGITVTNGAQLQFDQNTFETAYANNSTAVQNLFSQTSTGLGNVITSSINTLTDPVNGVITLQNQTLGTQVQQFQQSIDTLNTLLKQQRTLLETQFNDMEIALASLQSQSQVIDSLSNSKSATSTSSSAASSSSAG